MEDSEMVALMKQRRAEGLEALVEKYKRLSCAVAQSVLEGSGEDALECVNEAFFAIWRGIGAYDPDKATLKGWVAMVTRRRAIDARRKLARECAVPFENLETLPVVVTPEDAAAEREKSQQIGAFIRGLSETDRTILLRRYFLLERVDTVAMRLGLSRAAVDNRLTRIRKAMRAALEGSEQL